RPNDASRPPAPARRPAFRLLIRQGRPPMNSSADPGNGQRVRSSNTVPFAFGARPIISMTFPEHRGQPLRDYGDVDTNRAITAGPSPARTRPAGVPAAYSSFASGSRTGPAP